MKQWKIAMISMLMILLAACGTNQSEGADNSTGEEDLKPIKVSISTNPAAEEVTPGEAFTIQSKVTHDGENVNDADEVRFEFWKEGQSEEDHQMTEGEFTENGVYTMETTVDEAGTYYVISHVTARGMHNMPQQELTIGDSSSSSQGHHNSHEEEEATHDHGDHSSNTHEGEGHHDQDVMAHLMLEDQQSVGEEVSIVSHLKQQEAALEGADVQFEIWKEGAEKHQYVDAKEGNKGEYTAPFTFEEKGNYTVKLHFRKGEMHDHKEKSITVK